MAAGRAPLLTAAADADLIVAAIGGGTAAFGELTRRHGSAVRVLLCRMGADPATADDVAQEAFLQAFRAIGSLRGGEAFCAWVKRIAARLYIRRWRQEARYDLREDMPDEVVAGGGADPGLDLTAAMAALPEVERLAVALCYGAGMSYAEAAEALCVPTATIKSRMARAFDRMRPRLAAYGGAGGSV